jgi:hypothetical protein
MLAKIKHIREIQKMRGSQLIAHHTPPDDLIIAIHLDIHITVPRFIDPKSTLGAIKKEKSGWEEYTAW